MFTGDIIGNNFTTAVLGTQFIANSVSIYIFIMAIETLYSLTYPVLFPVVATE